MEFKSKEATISIACALAFAVMAFITIKRHDHVLQI